MWKRCGILKSDSALPTSAVATGRDHTKSKIPLRASWMRGRLQLWKSAWFIGPLHWQCGDLRARSQPLSRTKVFQHRLHCHEENEASRLGQRIARIGTSVFQLFQPPEFWVTRQQYFRPSVWPDPLHGTASYEHPRSWAGRRCVGENDSAEGATAVLSLNGKIPQKFSSIHILLLELQPCIAKWRPSGDGYPSVSPTAPAFFHNGCALPCRSTCRST
jgi:hypothetical protein